MKNLLMIIAMVSGFCASETFADVKQVKLEKPMLKCLAGKDKLNINSWLIDVELGEIFRHPPGDDIYFPAGKTFKPQKSVNETIFNFADRTFDPESFSVYVGAKGGKIVARFLPDEGSGSGFTGLCEKLQIGTVLKVNDIN